MKLYQVIILGSALAVFALAGTLVDQGQPGKQGSWPVSISGGTLSLNSAVTVDGGIVTVQSRTSTDNPPIAISYETTAAFVFPETIVIPSNGSACTTAGGSNCTRIYGAEPPSFIIYQNVTITITNAGANALTDCIVAWSTDNTNYEDWDVASFTNLAAGATRSMALSGNSRRFLKIWGRSASGTTTKVTVTANNRAI